MPATRRKGTDPGEGGRAPRMSVTFPPALYQTLEAIARSKKVSVAWVIRDAAEQYVEAQWPLLGRPQ